MARQIVVLALLLIALVGLVSADNDASASASPKSSSQGGAEDAAAAPGNDEDAIGNTDEAGAPTNSTGAGDEGAVVEGPIGSEDVAKIAAAAQPPTSGATNLWVSAVAGGAAAVAGYFVI